MSQQPAIVYLVSTHAENTISEAELTRAWFSHHIQRGTAGLKQQAVVSQVTIKPEFGSELSQNRCTIFKGHIWEGTISNTK